MKILCPWFKSKKNVSLFDNGLRIESGLNILNDNKWQYRYVVCQRRCTSEAPLMGIFKSDTAREQGQHLELFYLQNYIGYEYGFKVKRTNKTLAILVQGQTIIFSFFYADAMIFWKEWFKDVCAMYFMQAYIIPDDLSIMKLNSREVRIHITRYALVIVQDEPPKQRLYLSLEDLFDIFCVDNRFVFRAFSYSWSKPQEFFFVSNQRQIQLLSKKLHCLLSTDQFSHSNTAHLPQTHQLHLQNMENLTMTNSTTTVHQASLGPNAQNNRENGRLNSDAMSDTISWNQGLHKKRRICRSVGNLTDAIPLTFVGTKERNKEDKRPLIGSIKNGLNFEKPVYGNDDFRQYSMWVPELPNEDSGSGAIQRLSEAALKAPVSNLDHSTYLNSKKSDSSEFRYENCIEDNDSVNNVNIPDHLPQPTSKDIGHSKESEEETEDGAYAIPEMDSDVPQFTHISALQFMNPQVSVMEMESFIPPPGLIKPIPNGVFNKKFSKTLSKTLRENKYDGERSVRYPDEDDESITISPIRSLNSNRNHFLTSPTTNNLYNNKSKRSKEADETETFDSSVDSSILIDSAIQKGRERLRQSDRRNSKFSANSTKSGASNTILSRNPNTINNNDSNSSTLSNKEEEEEKVERIVEIAPDIR